MTEAIFVLLEVPLGTLTPQGHDGSYFCSSPNHDEKLFLFSPSTPRDSDSPGRTRTRMQFDRISPRENSGPPATFQNCLPRPSHLLGRSSWEEALRTKFPDITLSL